MEYTNNFLKINITKIIYISRGIKNTLCMCVRIGDNIILHRILYYISIFIL